MIGKSTLRLVLDPAIDLAVKDGADAFGARLVLILVLAPLLFFALSWGALAWGAVAVALEIEQQVFVRRRLAAHRVRRADRIGFLVRGLRGSAAWAAGPSALFFVHEGRFALAALIWAAGMALYTAAFSFRAASFAMAAAAPIGVMFLAAPVALAGRQPLITILMFAAFLMVFSGFALHAAIVNHQRERDLRLTRKKLIREAEAARHLAFHDQLTGLVNRRQLTQHITQAIAHADLHSEEVALLLIDLDRFKFVNDTYGHACGDDLLRDVAQRLLRAVRPGDICARLGGDEFVLLAPKCSARDAAKIAQRALKLLAEPLSLPAATVHSAGSIGVSLYVGGQGADANLLRQADLALYRVKEAGRNAFRFYETEMDQAAQSRRGLEADLREAVRTEAINVVYQPQFDREVMIGVEALARWTHPVRGSISPTIFIPLAEECGLVEDLGLLVIRRAFADSRRWPALRVAINLSPVQLRVPNFLSNLRRLVKSFGVAPQRIEFELTESILLADDVQTHDTLAALREMGFGLALDDFGTGYSSLSYLRKFPIDRIKIDRSFIASLPHDKVSEAVVRAVVQLGHTLGLKVMAEGVETPEQRCSLSEVGCHSVQGFLTGCPVESADISDAVRVATRNDEWVDAQSSPLLGARSLRPGQASDAR